MAVAIQREVVPLRRRVSVTPAVVVRLAMSLTGSTIHSGRSDAGLPAGWLRYSSGTSSVEAPAGWNVTSPPLVGG